MSSVDFICVRCCGEGVLICFSKGARARCQTAREDACVPISDPMLPELISKFFPGRLFQAEGPHFKTEAERCNRDRCAPVPGTLVAPGISEPQQRSKIRVVSRITERWRSACVRESDSF